MESVRKIYSQLFLKKEDKFIEMIEKIMELDGLMNEKI